ncbi:MAG: hypothetical protein EPO36_11760 [Chloroflexota bacterium]|nr:MAG: hypothetical protein EPO36_11760 [Chloroflexota bacterium]
MHPVAAYIATLHLQDLLREAEEDRRRAIIRGATRSHAVTITGRLAGLLHRLPRIGRRGSTAARPSGQRPATA